MAIEVKPEQYINAADPTQVTESGIAIESNLLQLSKAEKPMDVTDLRVVTVSNSRHPLKA